MAEVFDFGLQQHKIKMDGKFFENNLFAVAGDTGRRLEVQLLDSNNLVQNTTGISLRLNANVAGQATYAEATLVDATKGLYELDLPNGMLIAPGNWQFQWQIIGTGGEKLHSFAFTGSVGSNLSEGGSEATNFYLNAGELKQMQDDLINGTFNSEVLETNIAEKLSNLEEQYAPKLTEVTAHLAQTDARIDTFVSLPDGATTNDARLEDIKIGLGGTIYPSPGAHVRSIGKQLSETDLSFRYESKYGFDITNTDGILTQVKTGDKTWGFVEFLHEKVQFDDFGDYIMLSINPTNNYFLGVSISGVNYGRPCEFTSSHQYTHGTVIAGFPADLGKTNLTVTKKSSTIVSVSNGVVSFDLDITTYFGGAYTKTAIGVVASNYFADGFALAKITDYETKWSVLVDDKIQKAVRSLIPSEFGYQGKTAGLLGDSITAQNQYPPHLLSYLQLDNVNNYGVSGTTIAKESSSDINAFCLRYVGMSDLCDFILVFGGTNDYGLSLPLGSYSDTNTDLLTFYGALNVLCQGLKVKYPTKRLFFATPLQRDWTSGGQVSGIGPNAVGASLLDYVIAIKTVCQRYSIPVIDLYSNSGITKENITNWTSDRLHITNAGGKLIASQIAQEMKRYPII